MGTLQNLKYVYRKDIRDRAALEKDFREQFEALNRVRLTDGEFARMLDDIVSADLFAAARPCVTSTRSLATTARAELFTGECEGLVHPTPIYSVFTDS